MDTSGFSFNDMASQASLQTRYFMLHRFCFAFLYANHSALLVMGTCHRLLSTAKWPLGTIFLFILSRPDIPAGCSSPNLFQGVTRTSQMPPSSLQTPQHGNEPQAIQMQQGAVAVETATLKRLIAQLEAQNKPARKRRKDE